MIEPSLTLRIGTAAAFDTAYAVCAGVLMNRLWLGRRCTPAAEAQLHGWLAAGAAAMLVVLPLQLLLLSASMTGEPSWSAARAALPDVLGTHAGEALAMSFGFVPPLLAFALWRPALRSAGRVWIGLALVVGITVFRATFGHAASDGDWTVRELVQFFHLGSIAVWGGGVVVAGLAVARVCGDGEMVWFAGRLSRTVTVALGVVIATGIYNAWKGLGGSLTPLPHTAWGQMLMVKAALVGVTLLHGVRVRLLLRGEQPDRATRMRWWLGAEASLMLLVLVASAWLANLPPAEM